MSSEKQPHRKKKVTALVRGRAFDDIFWLVQDGRVAKIQAKRAFCMGHALSQAPKALEAHTNVFKMHFREAFVRILSVISRWVLKIESFKIFWQENRALATAECVVHCKQFVFSEAFFPDFEPGAVLQKVRP